MTSSSTLPYIGSKISLISNAGIRYEGVLFNINTQESTVGLSNVKTYGTEGRKPGGEVPPSDEVYDYIVFRGKDIQDLTVSEASPPDDPAILAINPIPTPTGTNHMMGSHQSAFMMAGGGGGGPPQQSGMMHRNIQPDTAAPYGGAPYGLRQGQMGGMNRGMPGMYGMMDRGQRDDMGRRNMYQGGGYMGGGNRRGGYGYRGGRGGRGGYSVGGYGGPRRIIGELTPQPNHTLKSQLEIAFDFDESNRKFDKSNNVTETNAVEGKENEKAALSGKSTSVYDKKTSFFDRISCDTLDRQSGQDTRVDRTKQRQLDLETFGQSAAAPMRRGGRNFRIRGPMGGQYGGGMMGHYVGGGYRPTNFQYSGRFAI